MRPDNAGQGGADYLPRLRGFTRQLGSEFPRRLPAAAFSLWPLLSGRRWWRVLVSVIAFCTVIMMPGWSDCQVLSLNEP